MGLNVQLSSKLKAVCHYLAVALVVCLPTVVAPVASVAQSTNGSISGTVTDASGALVPKAKVVLTSTTTGATQSTVSNKDGVFAFASVESGDYTLTITGKGFSTYSETGIHLDPQDRRVLHNLQLAVGSQADVVTVEAEDSSLPTDSGEVSSLISAEDIKHLAIEGRDVTELLKILPGFTPISGSVSNGAGYDPAQVGVSGAVGQYSGNGSPLYAVALLWDGADITDPGNFGATIQTVNYDQVSEVKVSTASMTADSPHGPIIINALGAYGGNQFHGSLYTYVRTYQLNSQDWYSKHTDQAKPMDRYIYPGFTFGGPILIPGTRFNEAKKLNFWVGAEDYAQRNVYAYGTANAATVTALVPTAGMRMGDFSQSQILSYLGGYYDKNNPGTSGFYGAPTTVNGFQHQNCSPNYNNLCEVPQIDEGGNAVINGNIAATLDPGAKVLLNMYPLPTPGVSPTGLTPYNYIHTNLIDQDLWQARGRVDYALGEKTKAFVVYSTETEKTEVPEIPYYAPASVMGATNTPGGMIDHLHSELGAMNVSTIITPSLTNEFYGSVTYFKENWKNKTTGDYVSTLGYPYQGLYSNSSPIVPQVADYGYDGLPIAMYQDYGSGGLFITKFIRTAGDNVTKQIRTHTLRGGLFAQMDTNNQPGGFYQPTNGTISQYYLPETFTTVNGQNIHDTAEVGSGSEGNILADFAEGNVYQFTQQNKAPGDNLYFWNIAGYAQDHWLPFRHLSLDFGLRIEHITPWSDAHGIGVPVWNANAYHNDQAGSPLPGFLWHDIDHSIPLSGYTTRWGYLEPRVGFSWDPFGKANTIFRGGFGIYRAHDSYNDASYGQANANGVEQLTQTITTLATVNTARAPVNAGNEASQIAGGAATPLYGVLAGDDEMPQVKTWDFAVVQRLPYKMQLQVAYVGSYSNHMINDGGQGQTAPLDNINALPVGAIYATGQYTTANYSEVAGLDTQAVDAFRPFPTYYDLDIAQHNLYSNYNGLQTSLLKQSGRFFFNINYTFSKALGVLGGYQNGEPIDPFNLRNNYLPEGFDRTHVFNASYTYVEGNAFHFGSNLLNSFINNWEVSGITNLLSGGNMQSLGGNANFGIGGTITGAPNPTQGSATANYTLPVSNLVFLGTPDVLLEPKVLCDPATSGNHQYFKNACFSLPTQLGTNGTYRFPYIHGPAFVDSDLTLTRNITLPRSQSLHLRVAAFNFLNRANPSFNTSIPGEYQLGYSDNNSSLTDLTDPSVLASIPNANANIFGKADLKVGRRILELSLKYNF